MGVRIYSRSTLIAFWTKHPTAASPLRAWFATVESAQWEGPADVRAVFGTVDFLANNRVVFNIGGNTFRLIARIAYKPYFAVNVCFLGTHAEYDRVDANTVTQ